MRQKEYISEHHSKHLIRYHIIFVCKYRKKILVGIIADDIIRIMNEIAEKSDFSIEAIEADKDHIHMLVKSSPKLSPLQIVRRLKQASTIAIWRLHRDTLRCMLFKNRTFWTDGYFVSSVGNVSVDTVRAYIERQG